MDCIVKRRGGGADTSNITTTPDKVLSPYIFLDKDGNEDVGEMVNRGTLNQSLNCGGNVSLNSGYYVGGTISANSLASQTSGTAIASQMLADTTAWVNGVKLTGTMVNRGNVVSELGCGSSYTIASGYYSGGTITAKSLASQTVGDAVASQIQFGKKAWVNGVLITGTMEILDENESCSLIMNEYGEIRLKYSGANRGCIDPSLSDLPFLFHDTDVVAISGLTANKLKANEKVLGITGNFTSDATATNMDIVGNKTAYVNGQKLTGGVGDYRGASPSSTNDSMGVCSVEVDQHSSYVHLCNSGETACVNNNSRLWLENLIPSNVKKGITIMAGDGEMDLFVGTYESIEPKISRVNFGDYFYPNNEYEYAISTGLPSLSLADKVNCIILFVGSFMDDNNVKCFIKHNNCTVDTSGLTNMGYTNCQISGDWQGGVIQASLSLYNEGSDVYLHFSNDTAYSGTTSLHGIFSIVKGPFIDGDMQQL